ncbi:BnaC06g01020D [Brassica napus]|uniref:BnaC06g01020D protein n=1 Tax=Brassica napus TaxID=3708 RepID=A0A078FHD9_BRANA|nr:BnaC06g01020D [Brassica napus]
MMMMIMIMMMMIISSLEPQYCSFYTVRTQILKLLITECRIFNLISSNISIELYGSSLDQTRMF